jgi:ergothioneine biosynthesis protein EgtB
MRLLDQYRAVRAQTEVLADALSAEDQQVQSMPDASPTKWHLAHTSWFFETFVLSSDAAVDYRSPDPRYRTLFNSYYDAVGERFDRSRRGTLSRPSLAEVRTYRRQVDDALMRLLEEGNASPTVLTTIELGLQHEQQHQELLLTDIKHALGSNPLQPAYDALSARVAPRGPGGEAEHRPTTFRTFGDGVVWIGHEGPGFAFDNEGPRHKAFLRSFALADRLVTCGEYLRFISDGGYRRPELWLSDGWQLCQREQWQAPLYWRLRQGDSHGDREWAIYTLAGPRPVDAIEPVVHVSYFEADAFARWAEARLPTEEEWEHVAAEEPVLGNFAESGRYHPATQGSGFFGDTWIWTQSPYVSYPGYRAPAGAIGEYNGKFMCNQMVLRGGSCFTPAGHVRPTYRNFFPPAARWQASGIRLARDA